MKKTILALAVMATFGLVGPASAAPALPQAATAPDMAIQVGHGHHHHGMRRHHHHGHGHHHHRRRHHHH